MLIFNTTYHIDDEIHDQCLLFLKDHYIAQAATSGFLHEPRLALIHAQHEEHGTSYSLQFKVKNMDTLNHWMSTQGTDLQQELTKKFSSKVAGFITLLEEIEL